MSGIVTKSGKGYRFDNFLTRARQWPLTTTATLLGRMARNRNYQPWGSTRFANYRAARKASKAGRSYTMQKRRKRQTRGVGVTTQHDSRLIYKKKRMPRRSRRRWVGFVKKVNAVAEKSWGSQTVVHNRAATFTNDVATNQCIAHCALYGLASNNSYYNDLKAISSYVGNANTDTATGLAVDATSRLFFQSAVLDITIRNASTNNNLLNSNARMEVDVYEIGMSKKASDSLFVWNDILEILNTNNTDSMMIGGLAPTTDRAEINIGYRGITPFELNYTLSRFGIRVYRKTKYQLANNDQITYQMRDPGRHAVVQKDIDRGQGFSYPGLSKYVLVIGKLAPGLTVGPVGTDGVYQERLVLAATRKYMFKIENWTEDRTLYRIGV